MDHKESRRVTMSDIAHALGISKNSVSLALGGKTGVSDNLRKRVIDKAIDLNYGKFPLIHDAKSQCIVVIVPEYLHNDIFFYSDIFWSIEGEAKNRNCNSIHISVSREMEQNLLLPPLPSGVNIIGLLVIGVLFEQYIERLHEMNIPMVTVDQAYSNVPVQSVMSSNLFGALKAVGHLLECGHRKIGFIGPVGTALSIYERWCGYNLAMNRAKLTPDPCYSIIGDYKCFKLFDEPEALEPYLAKIKSYPSAWFCGGDRIAISLIHLLTQKGIRIPEDISVIGFDDIAASQMILPRLTTIRIDRKLMGKIAMDSLCSLASGSDNGVINFRIPGELIIRDSVQVLT